MPHDPGPWLALARGTGSRARARRLLEALGDPLAVLDAGEARLAAHVPREIARALASGAPLVAARAELERAAALGARCLGLGHPGFPDALRRIPDPPLALYVRGPLPSGPALAVVGSRRATQRAREVARSWSAELAAAGAWVVSGLAYGIDAAAHRGALEAGGFTAAVLASGPDRASPRGNARLAQRILDAGGAWISEHPPGTPALPHHFPERNRLISGLARALLVVEARMASGSLWSARHALEQGREVLAVPGPIDTDACRGSNLLLRDGAHVALEAADVLWAVLGRDAPVARPAPPRDPALDPILEALREGPADAEALGSALGLSPAELAGTLLELELGGRVTRSGTRVALRAPGADP